MFSKNIGPFIGREVSVSRRPVYLDVRVGRGFVVVSFRSIVNLIEDILSRVGLLVFEWFDGRLAVRPYHNT